MKTLVMIDQKHLHLFAELAVKHNIAMRVIDEDNLYEFRNTVDELSAEWYSSEEWDSSSC